MSNPLAQSLDEALDGQCTMCLQRTAVRPLGIKVRESATYICTRCESRLSKLIATAGKQQNLPENWDIWQFRAFYESERRKYEDEFLIVIDKDAGFITFGEDAIIAEKFKNSGWLPFDDDQRVGSALFDNEGNPIKNDYVVLDEQQLCRMAANLSDIRRVLVINRIYQPGE